MYQVGDLVIYGSSGVCRVSAVGKPGVSYVDEGKDYYTLSPLYGTEVIYAPVDTKVYMRPTLTREEAEQFIREMPGMQEQELDGKNLQLLVRQYQDAFQPHDCTALAKLIKTAYCKNTAARKCGKKPGKVDEKYMKRAEELLYGELAVALGISRDSVPQYIREALRTEPRGAAGHPACPGA